MCSVPLLRDSTHVTRVAPLLIFPLITRLQFQPEPDPLTEPAVLPVRPSVFRTPYDPVGRNNWVNWTIIIVLFILSLILAAQVAAPNLFPAV